MLKRGPLPWDARMSEEPVQSRSHAITTETLRRMDDIFEAAWQELLRRRSRHTFPWTIESTRFLLARVVLEHARDYRDEGEIIDDVVERIESRDIAQ